MWAPTFKYKDPPSFVALLYLKIDDEILVKSTTGRFAIKDNCDTFTISDTDGKIFRLEGRYSNYEKTGLLYEPARLVCNYPKLKELLLDDNIF